MYVWLVCFSCKKLQKGRGGKQVMAMREMQLELTPPTPALPG